MLLLCTSSFLVAQNEAANWYFGDHAGLNFSGGTPVALTNGSLSTIEGCSTISDFNGNLLFYTDGITVWNRSHTPMPNGTGLKGHPSSTQSGIIVPHPGNPNQYYVFTVAEGGGPDGLQYNLVDLTLDGGQGDLITKNQLLETPVTERLTAVAHANGSDIWVLAHKHDSNEFVAYLVTPTGLNTTPIISATGYTYVADASQNDARGYMKVSPDGSLLAIATSRNLEILQFNSTTGTFSNPIKLYSFIINYDLNYSPFPYGVEFSSDSSRLFVTTTYYRNFNDRYYTIHQFDVSSYNVGDIIASGMLISPRQLNSIEALQLAIDGKIYVAQNGQNYLGVIGNPNVLGMGCNYIENGVSLAGRTSSSGLPPFIQSYFVVGLQIRNFCFGDITEYTVNTSSPVTSINWDFGDGNTSSIENPTHIYASPGTYTISVTATTATETKTESKDISIYEVPVANSATDFEVCSTSFTHQFDLSTKDVEVLGTQLPTNNTIAYYPTLADAQNGTNPLPNLYTNTSTRETIFARISSVNNPSCYGTTTFDLLIKEAPILNTVADWAICDTDMDGLYDFDLTQKDAEVLGGQNAATFTISYFEAQTDADNDTNAIGPNYTNTAPAQQIFFRIENTGSPECYKTGSFQLEVITGVSARVPTNMETCDDDNDGIGTFDLTANNNEILGGQSPTSFGVSYYRTQLDAEAGTNAINNATGYTNTVPYAESIYARVGNMGNPDCYNTVSFALMVHDSPIRRSVSDWQVCDDDNDGEYDFALTEKNAEILGNQSDNDFTITYHGTLADATAGQNAIVGPYQNTDVPQTIYYRLENKAHASCSLTDSFMLQVFDVPTATAPAPMVSCDMDGTGEQTFELATKDTEILNGQDPNTYVVSYYGNAADADAGQDPLSKTAYTNSAQRETIFARIQNKGNPSCYDVTSFGIMVDPLPIPQIEPTYVICPDSPELIIDAGYFESWSWQNENNTVIGTGRTLNVTELGDYYLSVTRSMNGITCENKVPFTVISSGAPEGLTVNVSGFSDRVTLELEASGSGDFEYSMDGENFQDYDRFEVFPGEYTVYVRDRSGCRTLSKEVLALGYQRFFTPNGDGSNEFWTVIGMESFPDSQLYIFDRYGKLLKQLSPTGQGWDGTYNGRRMPSSDYWFRYVYGDGKVFKGHFSLKR